MLDLFEDKRSDLIAKGKRGEREKGDGKTRYEKRVKSRFSSSTREYNNIDMNSLFKEGILTVGIPITGETDNYIVTIKFGNLLDKLKNRSVNDKLDLRSIIRSLIDGFDDGDVYIHCSCPDWQYRMAYWATMDDLNSGTPENRPSDITNPDNKLGPGCKHVMLTLANSAWLIKVASVINNYIKYFEKNRQKQYADIIYPAIFGKKYEEPVQLSFDDKDELDSDKSLIDTSNELGAVSGRFKKGNPYRFKPDSSKEEKGQISIDNIKN